MYILAINPGSTSTKVALYQDETLVKEQNLRHDRQALQSFSSSMEQFEMRKEEVLKFLASTGVKTGELSAVVGRGGLMGKIKAGAYAVNDAMIRRLRENPIIDHASNVACAICKSIADPEGIPAFIYDGISADERQELAKISGIERGIERYGYCHVLNTKAMCRKLAKELGGNYEDYTFIVAHIGGGITVNIHKGGRIIDLATDDEGSYSLDRAGRVCVRQVINMAYSKQYPTKESLREKLRNNSGFRGYLDVNDALEVEELIQNGNQEALLLYEGMAYQISKVIGELSTVEKGKIDYIILTGGIAHSKMLTDWIKERVGFIAEVRVMPGENELESLAYGALRVLRGEEEAHEYVDDMGY